MLRLMSVLVLGSVFVGQAHAETATRIEEDVTPVLVDDGDQVRLVLGLQTGGVAGLYGHDGAMEFGLSLDIRTAPVTFGVVGSATVVSLWARNMAQVGLHGGHTFMLNANTALDVLGELGLRSDSVEDGLLSGDPGYSVETLYLGARVNLDFALTDPRAAVALRAGVGTFLRVDLEAPQKETYEYDDCFLSTCSTVTTTHTAGGNVDLGVLFTISADFGG